MKDNINDIHVNIQNIYEWVSGGNIPELRSMAVVPPWDSAVYYFNHNLVSERFDMHPPPFVSIKMSLFPLGDDAVGKNHNGLFISDASKMLSSFTVMSDGIEIGSVYQTFDEHGYDAGEIGVQCSPRITEIMNGLGIDEDEHAAELAYTVLVINFANALAHCKNIELIDEPMTRQVRRMKERKNKIIYKVLSIEPFRKQIRREAANRGESEIKRALHICRGHFATYTEERPLFGRITGTFWKPMHVRGNHSNGAVIKDYEIAVAP